MNRKKTGLTGAALAMMILILDSRAAAEAAAAGVTVCIRTVIPSLFPFFLLSGYLTGSLNGGKMARLIGQVFHAPGNCGGVILTGLLGGYPVGAKSAAETYRSGAITKAQGDRLLWFCSQAGPSFLFGMAAAQFEGAGYAWMLWGIQLLSALSVAWLLPKQEDTISPRSKSAPIHWNDVMRSSLSALATVCGWVVVFSVVIQFLKRWVLWLLPEAEQTLLCGILELTNGCLLLSEVENMQLRFLLAAVMLNFGGLCVLMQTSSVANGLNLKGYLGGKCLQTLFAALYALTWMGNFWTLIPILCAFSIKILPVSRKRGSIPGRIGV